MATSVEKREARLLRWEYYLRRTRHVAIWLGVLVFVLPILLSTWDARLTEDATELTLWAGIFLLAWAYISHLKIRHIESIKYHREADAAQ